MNRRHFLRSVGTCIALPFFESAFPRGQAFAEVPPGARKKRFIGCFFGSGAPMPDAQNGEWTLDGVLSSLRTTKVDGNVAILRGFRAVSNFDVHWSGTAGFLSATEVGTTNNPNPSSDPSYMRCAKSFDQWIADTAPPSARIRSLHAGYSQLAGWDEGHDRKGSIQYVNAISWREPTKPNPNTNDPTQLFTQVFGSGGQVSDAYAKYVLERKKSMLDGVLSQYNSFKANLSPSDKTKLDAYSESIREIEKDLTNAAKGTTCERPSEAQDPMSYRRSFLTMHKIIVAAMKCDLTRAATVMYNDGIGPNRPVDGLDGEQHGCAHGDWPKLAEINRVQVGLWADLLAQLRDANLLGETVVVLGSNMSDGRSHNAANVPLLVASQNVAGEMKLGGEVLGTTDVTNLSQNRTMADLYVDLFKLYGISRTFGTGSYASTGKASGILT